MKKKRKRRRIKVMNILIALGVLILIIMFISNLIGKLSKDFKVELKETTVNVGSEFKNEFKATFKGIDVTSNVTVDTNLDSNKAGKYNVAYIYKKNNKEYREVKKVTVIDKEIPKLTLKGGKDIIVMLNSKFKDPGYVAIDNSDGDISDEVKVLGTVDTEKEGQYILTYEVSDKSGNTATEKRKITVTKDSPLNMSVKDFTLDGLFKGVTLEETEDGGEEYIDNIIFAGDSMALYYVINDEIPGTQLWHQVSITPETALTSPIYINHIDTEKTFVENFELEKPDMVIMTLGTNSAAYMSAEYFYEKYTELVQKIKKASPNTKLIIQSIPPVDASFDESNTGINNDKINKLNYYIGKMCEELDVKFLNSAPAMKDSNGACMEGYCRSDDGIHPTAKGSAALIKFARTHMYKE